MVNKQRLAKMELAVIATLLPALIVGCGGGGKTLGRSAGGQLTQLPVTQRSVNLHNYNCWDFPNSTPENMDKMLQVLAQRQNVCFTETFEHANSLSGWQKISVQTIKTLNPSARVYRLFDMMSKPNWDTDYNKPSDTRRMDCPITRQAIDAHDWWLRDSRGTIISENSTTRLLDVGKPGFKEAFLQACLRRTAGKGFDGFVFDYVPLDLTAPWYAKYSRPEAYPTDQDYLEKAVKPFITYVVDGLHVAGYRVVGNCIGQFGSTSPAEDFVRTKMDADVYEHSAIGTNGGWIPGNWLEERIKAVANDPLEVWVGEGFLMNTATNFDAKQLVSLAFYYISIPASQAKRSYHSAYNRKPHWQAVWDLYIGTPAANPVKMPDKYFWSRQYTNGIVLLNYEAKTSVQYTLDKTYHDAAKKTYKGKISLPAHTALILAAG